MPLITKEPKSMGNIVVTEFVDSADTSGTTFTLPSSQDTLHLSNIGPNNIVVSVGTQSNITIPAYKEMTFNETFTSFTINAANGIGSFRATCSYQSSDEADEQVLSGKIDSLTTSMADMTTKKADRSYVDTQIGNIGNASPKGTYATLSALQTAFPTGTTGIYLVTADGKWYYWSGSAWTAGGTYQSTGIADGSISLQQTNFGVRTINMVNNSAAGWKQGRYNTTDAYVVSSQKIYMTKDINYTASWLQVLDSTFPARNIRIMDVNENVLGSISLSANSYQVPLTFSISSATYPAYDHIRVELNTNNGSITVTPAQYEALNTQLQIEQGSTKSNYQPYFILYGQKSIPYGALSDSSVDTNNYKDSSITGQKVADNTIGLGQVNFSTRTTNMVDNTARFWKQGRYNDTTAYIVSSNKIYLAKDTNYTASWLQVMDNTFPARTIRLLDVNETSLGTISLAANTYMYPYTFSISSATYPTYDHVRVELNTNNVSNLITPAQYETLNTQLQIEAGTVKTRYRPYYKLAISGLSKDFIVVSQNGKGDYTTISAAVADAVDGDVILVMPGSYQESVATGTKYISIIGLDKTKTTLWNSTGDYNTPPLYMTIGYLKGMTIQSVKDPAIDYSGISKINYGIHIDINFPSSAWKKNFTIEDCIVSSDFDDALGCGITDGYTLKIKNSEISTSSLSTNQGIAIHNTTTTSAATVILDNNRIRSSNSKAFWLSNIAPAGVSSIINLTSYNNIFYSVNDPDPIGIIDNTWVTLSHDSFGNNSSKLNYIA